MKINRALSIVLAALMLVAMLPSFAFAEVAGTVTVSGNSEFVSAPAGTYSKLAYTAVYSDGQCEVTSPKAFGWRVTKDNAPATDAWCVDGEFIVSGGASGTYNIVATHRETGIKSAQFPVTVTPSVLYDWDTNRAGTIKESALTTDETGNKYYPNKFDIDYSSNALDKGIKTLHIKFRVPKGSDTDKEAYVVQTKDGWKGHIATISNSSSFPAIQSGKFALTVKAGSYSPLCDDSGNIKNLDYDEWYELVAVFDLTDPEEYRITDLYLEGEHCKTIDARGNINESVPLNLKSTSNLRFGTYDATSNKYSYADDVVMYSGTPYTGIIPSSECTVAGEAFDTDSDTLENGQTLSFTFSAKQIQESAETYMVVAATYTSDGKELLSADAKDLTTEKDASKSITVSATKTQDSLIKIFVFKKADISPVIYNSIK